jgi:hypothetical protein
VSAIATAFDKGKFRAVHTYLSCTFGVDWERSKLPFIHPQPRSYAWPA